MSDFARHVNGGRIGGEKLPGERAEHAHLRRDPGDRSPPVRPSPQARTPRHIRPRRGKGGRRRSDIASATNAKPIRLFPGKATPRRVRRIALCRRATTTGRPFSLQRASASASSAASGSASRRRQSSGKKTQSWRKVRLRQADLYCRHDWVFLPDEPPPPACGSRSRPRMQRRWRAGSKKGGPVVVARGQQGDAPDLLRLGLALPGKRRIGLALAADALALRRRPPFFLDVVEHGAAFWPEAMRELAATIAGFAPPMRVFGSFAWPFFAADPAAVYVTPESDIDLLLTPARGGHCRPGSPCCRISKAAGRRCASMARSRCLAAISVSFLGANPRRGRKNFGQGRDDVSCARSTPSTHSFRRGPHHDPDHFRADLRGAAGDIGRLAIQALLTELMLNPKPGLVSPVDNGAHDDMNVTTFVRSLLALALLFHGDRGGRRTRGGLWRIATFGDRAERQMLAATGGINTHRGAIFCLGFLAAAAGWRQARGLDLHGERLTETILDLWGEGVMEAGARPRIPMASARSGAMARAAPVRSCRRVCRLCWESRFGFARRAEANLLRRARLHSMPVRHHGELHDTNLLHRGGREGLAFVRNAARRFLDAGRCSCAGLAQRALDLHGDCVALHLSPGGAADCLAAAWFVHGLSR